MITRDICDIYHITTTVLQGQGAEEKEETAILREAQQLVSDNNIVLYPGKPS